MSESNLNAISAVTGHAETGHANTGDEEIDAALAQLTHLGDLPVEKHPAVFDSVHAELRAALTNAVGDEETAEGP